jgi:hypothetical protein
MFDPQQPNVESHIGARPFFAGVVGRNTADYLMQSAQRHHVQLSQMADQKAGMIITVSSVVLTLALGNAMKPELRVSLLTLAGFTLAALLCAVIAVMPKFRPMKLNAQSTLPAFFNPIFFAHFAEIPRERFYQMLGETLRSDAAVYETLANDLYSLGIYLARHKYPYLRAAYIFFITGFVVACVEQVIRFL